MRKSNSFVKKIKNINNLINNLLQKNLNKLKFDNLLNLAKSNKIILFIVASIFIFITYLLLPSFFNKSEISKKLEKDLSENFKINFNLSKNLNYNFFPKPHFIIQDAIINYKEKDISEINKLKIYLTLGNLFSLKDLKLKNVIIENANFTLNKVNHEFFIKLLKNDFKNSTLKIYNSNIFFENLQNEILFINKILEMKYFYNPKELKNILYSKNELFNLPYEILIDNNEIEKKLKSKINLNFLRLQIENEYNYKNKIKTGKANLLFNKFKSTISYKVNDNSLEFDFFDKLENSKFLYIGNLNFDPFYSSLEGKTEQLDLSYLFNSNSIITQLLKTEILNSKNIDFKFNVNANKIHNNFIFENLNLNSKIEEGLIDLDNTELEWKNFAKFNLKDSLIFVKDGELIIDGNLKIKILNFNEIYKYLLTPKKFRKKLEKIDVNFSYNIDQKTIKLTNLRINDQYNQNINKVLQSIVLKENNIQNKIFLKNLFNKAIKFYEG